MASLRSKDLLSIAQLSVEEIALILSTAGALKEAAARPPKKVPALRGKTAINLFIEPSTHTRSSFELAEERLRVDILNLTAPTGAMTKRETLVDTARNLEAMEPDFIVVRHSSAGVPHLLGRLCRSSVINAGDGMHEHPTLAVRDALTIREHKGRMEDLKIAIIGDIAHSRVARSLTLLYHKMGAEVCVCGPPMLLPWDYGRLGAKMTHHIHEALEDADVVMMLRIQHERHSEAFVPSTREYFNLYGLTRERMRLAKPDALIMHPGPMNDGLEIESEVADGSYPVILDHVANGVAARMAVLYLLSGGARLKSEKRRR